MATQKEINEKAKNNFLALLRSEGYSTEDEYTNSRTYLNLKCPKGHVRHKKPDQFKNGARCIVCAGKCPKHSELLIKESCKKLDMEMLSDYIDWRTPIKVKCSKGHVHYKRPSGIKAGYQCKECVKGGKYSELYFHNNPEMIESYGEFYSFEFTQEGQKYLMVGITKNWRSRKAGYSKLDAKDVRVTPMKLYDAFKLEQQFLKENDHLRPTESLGFKGWTECIRIEE